MRWRNRAPGVSIQRCQRVYHRIVVVGEPLRSRVFLKERPFLNAWGAVLAQASWFPGG